MFGSPPFNRPELFSYQWARGVLSLSSSRSGLIFQATPIDDESENGDDYDVPAPKKKARTPARSVSPQPPKISKPLGEANDNIADDERKIEEPFKVMKPLIIKKKSKATLVDDDEEEVQPEKKKKRKLLGVQPAFQWDSIMNVSRLSSHGMMLMIVWRWCYSFDFITFEANCCKDRLHPKDRFRQCSFVEGFV